MKFEEILLKAPEEIRTLINDLAGLRERPDYHPEENCRIHVQIVYERLLDTCNPNLWLSALFHDCGKLVKNIKNPKTGWPTAPNHDKFGADMVRKYSDWVIEMGGDPEIVEEICAQHMRVKSFDDMRPSTQQEIMLLKSWNELKLFTKADDMLREWRWIN